MRLQRHTPPGRSARLVATLFGIVAIVLGVVWAAPRASEAAAGWMSTPRVRVVQMDVPGGLPVAAQRSTTVPAGAERASAASASAAASPAAATASAAAAAPITLDAGIRFSMAGVVCDTPRDSGGCARAPSYQSRRGRLEPLARGRAPAERPGRRCRRVVHRPSLGRCCPLRPGERARRRDARARRAHERARRGHRQRRGRGRHGGRHRRRAPGGGGRRRHQPHSPRGRQHRRTPTDRHARAVGRRRVAAQGLARATPPSRWPSSITPTPATTTRRRTRRRSCAASTPTTRRRWAGTTSATTSSSTASAPSTRVATAASPRGVVGAQVLGFNTGSTGISVIGTYTDAAPPAAAMTSLETPARLEALARRPRPAGDGPMTCGSTEKFKAGAIGHPARDRRPPRRQLHGVPRRRAVRAVAGRALRRRAAHGPGAVDRHPDDLGDVRAGEQHGDLRGRGDRRCGRARRRRRHRPATAGDGGRLDDWRTAHALRRRGLLARRSR